MTIQRAKSRYQHQMWMRHHRASVLLVCVILLMVFVPTILFAQWRYRAQLQVWFFDIGQGDATFIQTPEGKQILIDGGPSDAVLQKLAGVMWPWDRTLDAVIVTHPDADHISGLVHVLEWYDVEMVIETGARGTTPVIAALSKAIEQEQAEHRLIKAGDQLVFDDLVFHVLWPLHTYEGERPDDRNNTSIVLEGVFGNTSMLFTGDAEQETEMGILTTAPDVDVLKAGHHGSSTSSSTVFLKQIRPEVVTISAGEQNRYGHPHPVVLQRLSEIGAEVWRTDLDGDLLLTSDGDEPTVRANPLPF